MSVYSERDLILRAMGYPSYRDYLKSSLWAGIRSVVLKNKSWRCQCCPDKATQVHHQKYDEQTMKGEDLRNLVPLCRKCHKRVEFWGKKGTGRKRGFRSVTYQARKRMRIYRKNKKIDKERVKKGLPPVYFP